MCPVSVGVLCRAFSHIVVDYAEQSVRAMHVALVALLRNDGEFCKNACV